LTIILLDGICFTGPSTDISVGYLITEQRGVIKSSTPTTDYFVGESYGEVKN